MLGWLDQMHLSDTIKMHINTKKSAVFHAKCLTVDFEK